MEKAAIPCRELMRSTYRRYPDLGQVTINTVPRILIYSGLSCEWTDFDIFLINNSI